MILPLPATKIHHISGHKPTTKLLNIFLGGAGACASVLTHLGICATVYVIRYSMIIVCTVISNVLCFLR